MTGQWTIFASGGENPLMLTHAQSGTNFNGDLISFASGGEILDFVAGACMEFGDGRANNLVLDNGGTAYYVPDLPADTNLTLDSGTTFDLSAQAATLGSVTMTDGAITDGSLSAASVVAENGEIDANLVGGPVKVTGGYVAMTGNNTYTGGTTIGTSSTDDGTLAVGSNGLGDGAVTFAGPGTLQARVTCHSPIRRISSCRTI